MKFHLPPKHPTHTWNLKLSELKSNTKTIKTPYTEIRSDNLDYKSHISTLSGQVKDRTSIDNGLTPKFWTI